VSYPGGSGGEWPPQNNPNQQPGFPQQQPQQGGWPQQPQPQGGYPQSNPQGFPQQPQGFPQQPQQGGYPQTGPQGFPQQPGFPQQGGGYPQSNPQGFPQQQPQAWGQDPYAQQQQFPGGQQPFGYTGPPKKKRTGLAITAVVAVVALAAGAVVTVYALKNSNDVAAGAPSPAAAANNLVSALGSGDVIGIMNGLAPAEAKLSKDYLTGTVDELKRLEVLKKDADPNKLSGVEFKAENIKFDEGAAETVNDHLVINKLTEGKITLTSDVKKIPLTDKLVEAMGAQNEKSTTETIDIAEEIKKSNKGEPIRIASIKVGSDWYPSLFYTIADNYLHEEKLKWPTSPIAPAGAGSASDAAKQMVEAGMGADLKKVIALLPPDEMGVIQDLGPVLIDQAGRIPATGAKLTAFETDSKEVTGGTLLTIKKLSVEVDGEKVEIVRSGDCYAVTAQGKEQKLCADEITQLIEQQGGKNVPNAAIDVIGRIGARVLKDGIGVVSTKVDGKWYVSPVRTYSELGLTLMRGLEPKDVDELLKLVK
jgi:hypothetical protein